MNKIIALGETHHGTHLDKIKIFFKKEKNIDGLFIELSISYQKSIDEYLKNRKIDEKLNRFFEGVMKEGKNVKDTLLFLIDFAIKKNLPVVCIDSSKIQTEEYNKISQHGKWFLKGESRDEDMFNSIIENIKNNEKWVIFSGAMHLINETHYRTGKKTLGAMLKKRFKDNFTVIILK